MYLNNCPDSVQVFELDPACFLTTPWISTASSRKNESSKTRSITDIDMLLMVDKVIRGGVCHAIHRYAKTNKKYMKNYDQNIESTYLKYLDVNILYGWAMSQKLPVSGFKWIENKSQFDKDLIKSYNQDSGEGHFLEVDGQYPEKMRDLHYDLQSLPKRMKIEKVEKVVANLHDKKEYFIPIGTFKQALNHGLVFKKVHRG